MNNIILLVIVVFATLFLVGSIIVVIDGLTNRPSYGYVKLKFSQFISFYSIDEQLFDVDYPYPYYKIKKDKSIFGYHYRPIRFSLIDQIRYEAFYSKKHRQEVKRKEIDRQIEFINDMKNNIKNEEQKAREQFEQARINLENIINKQSELSEQTQHEA